jgi:hypothetical protein
MSKRPICVVAVGTDGPGDAMVIVIDPEGVPEIAVEHQGDPVTPAIATGTTDDGTRWLVAWLTGINGGDGASSPTITVDGTPCEV